MDELAQTLGQAATGAFTALCLVLVAGFLTLVMIPRLHTPVRAWLRPHAIHHVESGLDLVLAAQRWQSPWLTQLFTKSSHSVSVTFYASFLPMLFWLGLPELGRDLVCLMALALYVGNAIKDLVCSPRPLSVSYGKQRLKFLGASDEEVELNAKEYGLPSSHTLNTLCLNYMIVWYLYDRQLIAAGTAAILYCLVALWVMWIAASRLYLGLHTPIDILAGAVAGLAVLVCFIAIEGHLSRWVLAGPQAVVHAAAASLVLLRLHPRPLAHTPSYEFTTSFMGSMFGVVAGLAELWSGRDRLLAGSRLLWAARRLGVGFVVVGAFKEGSRAVLLAALPLLYRFFPLPVRRLWQPPVHNLAKAPPQQQQQQQQHRKGKNSQQEEEQDGFLQQQDGKLAAAAAARQRRRSLRGGAAPAAEGLAAAGAAAEEAAASPVDPRLAELPHNAQGLPWDVDVTSRFFAYSAIGVAVAGVVPRILEALDW
ncbi:hypothetical protein CHLNCDRAFT_138478 [Chlorella variabilis]|uniref:Phosphatidic acid phosphatase type 2/haloperoxidase domain-containing protein n=1 Tax=Chlorella variabilis TaxID=554065 RepID=E1ZN53_CHLVA|nr:hypothetical protein CHLNCDRAFT_138478 [Chlorella variabilis]EFN52812.1 hypothetical protein CHLNCDRAFT_138478 [Chlorella variabilis]|eukprot:XP_005844914.1 hypothetical protein CHLNCDRAFT_138478 [Chlorella variabilis]